MVELMELPSIDINDTETGCCPRFYPELWQDKDFQLDEYLFVKTETISFMHMPINMGKVFARTQELIKSSDANTKNGYLILSKDVSPWKAEHYFLVDKPVEELENTHITGTFHTKVYDGEYPQLPHYMEKMRDKLERENLAVNDMYVFYTTCPKCAKYYGHNYMVIFAKISS